MVSFWIEWRNFFLLFVFALFCEHVLVCASMVNTQCNATSLSAATRCLYFCVLLVQSPCLYTMLYIRLYTLSFTFDCCVWLWDMTPHRYSHNISALLHSIIHANSGFLSNFNRFIVFNQAATTESYKKSSFFHRSMLKWAFIYSFAVINNIFYRIISNWNCFAKCQYTQATIIHLNVYTIFLFCLWSWHLLTRHQALLSYKHIKNQQNQMTFLFFSLTLSPNYMCCYLFSLTCNIFCSLHIYKVNERKRPHNTLVFR